MKIKIATAALLFGCQALYSSALGWDGRDPAGAGVARPPAVIAQAPGAPSFSSGREDMAATQGQPSPYRHKRGRTGKRRHGTRSHGKRRVSASGPYASSACDDAGGEAGSLGNACCAPAGGCM